MGAARTRPGPGQVRVRVEACGVCRTDLHVVDGELADAKLPIVPATRSSAWSRRPGGGVTSIGQRVGVAWLGHACGIAPIASAGGRALRHAAVHRLHPDGGFADPCDRRGGFRLPAGRGLDPDARALMCAGLIGYRSLKAAGEGRHDRPLRLRRGGAYHDPGGRCQGRRVFAFTRPGDTAAQEFAR